MYADTAKELVGHSTALMYIGDKRPCELDANEAVPIEIDDTGAFLIEFNTYVKNKDTCHIMLPGKSFKFKVIMSIGVDFMKNAG